MNHKKPEELKLLDQLGKIDIDIECFKIFENPQAYFATYMENKDKYALLLIKFSVFNILRKIDSSQTLSKKNIEHFMKKYTIMEWMDKISEFYSYALTIMDYLIEENDNVILDLYNEKKINKDIMEMSINSFIPAKKQLEEDRKIILKCMKEIEIEKSRVQEFL